MYSEQQLREMAREIGGPRHWRCQCNQCQRITAALQRVQANAKETYTQHCNMTAKLAAALRAALAHIPFDVSHATFWEDDEGTVVEHDWHKVLTSILIDARKMGVLPE